MAVDTIDQSFKPPEREDFVLHIVNPQEALDELRRRLDVVLLHRGPKERKRLWEHMAATAEKTAEEKHPEAYEAWDRIVFVIDQVRAILAGWELDDLERYCNEVNGRLYHSVGTDGGSDEIPPEFMRNTRANGISMKESLN